MMVDSRIWQRARCVVLVAVLVPAVIGAQPASEAPATWDWKNVTITEAADSAPDCRYVRILIREYRMEPGWNGTVSGSYLRHFWHAWLRRQGAGADQCSSGRGAEDLPQNRSDAWAVQGQREVDGSIGLRAVRMVCNGACDDGTQLQQEFRTTLALRGGGAADSGEGTGEGPIRLVAADVVASDQESAIDSFAALMQPLADGDCNRYYSSSNDQSVQRRFPSDVFCRAVAPLGSLLNDALYRSPNPIAVRISSGLLRGDGNLILIDGDVLILTNFVMDNDGGNVPLAAILRRQDDRSWRFLRVYL